MTRLLIEETKRHALAVGRPLRRADDIARAVDRAVKDLDQVGFFRVRLRQVVKVDKDLVLGDLVVRNGPARLGRFGESIPIPDVVDFPHAEPRRRTGSSHQRQLLPIRADPISADRLTLGQRRTELPNNRLAEADAKDRLGSLVGEARTVGEIRDGTLRSLCHRQPRRYLLADFPPVDVTS